jgi:hypothetical protein
MIIISCIEYKSSHPDWGNQYQKLHKSELKFKVGLTQLTRDAI